MLVSLANLPAPKPFPIDEDLLVRTLSEDLENIDWGYYTLGVDRIPFWDDSVNHDVGGGETLGDENPLAGTPAFIGDRAAFMWPAGPEQHNSTTVADVAGEAGNICQIVRSRTPPMPPVQPEPLAGAGNNGRENGERNAQKKPKSSRRRGKRRGMGGRKKKDR
jgi:hypothetical protein